MSPSSFIKKLSNLLVNSHKRSGALPWHCALSRAPPLSLMHLGTQRCGPWPKSPRGYLKLWVAEHHQGGAGAATVVLHKRHVHAPDPLQACEGGVQLPSLRVLVHNTGLQRGLLPESRNRSSGPPGPETPHPAVQLRPPSRGVQARELEFYQGPSGSRNPSLSWDPDAVPEATALKPASQKQAQAPAALSQGL